MRFPVKTPWYKRLKLLRTDLELTQEQMALKIGVSHRNYWRWEEGLTVPIETFRQKISEACGVPMETIFPEMPMRKADYAVGGHK